MDPQAQIEALRTAPPAEKEGGRGPIDYLVDTLRGFLPPTKSPIGWAANKVSGGRYAKIAPEYGGIYRDPNESPEEAALGLALMFPTGLQAAYHGTPHAWEGAGAKPEAAVGKTFDLSKVGTGEGAQAYGYGAYMTKEPSIAEGYRRNLSAKNEPALMVRGKNLAEAEHGLSPEAARYLRQEADPLLSGRTNAADPESALFWAKTKLSSMADDTKRWLSLAPDPTQPNAVQWKNSLGEYERALADLNALKPEDIQIRQPGEGRLYKLDAPEDAELMHFDKPFSRQPESVKPKILEALRKAKASSEFLDAIQNPTSGFDDAPGRAIYRMVGSGDPTKASEALRSAGIPGHLYTGDTSGVQNMVIYDPARAPVVDAAKTLAEALRNNPSFTAPIPPKVKP